MTKFALKGKKTSRKPVRNTISSPSKTMATAESDPHKYRSGAAPSDQKDLKNTNDVLDWLS